MSVVVINLTDLGNGFKQVTVDGKHCGSLEDPEDSAATVISNIIRKGHIDNVMVRDHKGIVR
jgi:hypothetical protein